MQKYKLPPNHPLFLGQSVASLNLEHYEDLWIREAELRDRTRTEEGSALNEALGQLHEIRKALDIEQAFDTARTTGTDDLVDKWEREVAAGRVPDLDEM